MSTPVTRCPFLSTLSPSISGVGPPYTRCPGAGHGGHSEPASPPDAKLLGCVMASVKRRETGRAASALPTVLLRCSDWDTALNTIVTRWPGAWVGDWLSPAWGRTSTAQITCAGRNVGYCQHYVQSGRVHWYTVKTLEE
jgi:hypothetical protein